MHITYALSAAIAALLVAETLHAEGVVMGRVADRESGSPIPGANVVLAGTHVGTSTGADGRFVINTASGSFTLRISHIGHLTDSRAITLGDGDTLTVNVLLAPAPIATQPITVTAMLGAPRESPVTFTDLEVRDLRERYTVQDVPVLLSELPSTTYYSESGTATGYTYLNIRGFDARRISVMVNGVPQNDPEDHNVYWLDMPDLPASLEEIQVQRGAGSAFYGPPAIGGSVNLVTRNIAAERALEVSGGYGSYNTRKFSVSATSGLFAERYAIHARLSAIESDGYRDRAWVDYRSYFLGVARYDTDMTTQINLYGGPIADGLAFYGIPKADVKDRAKRRANPISRPEEMENFSQPHYELLHEWRLSPVLTMNNTVFYIRGDGFFDYDGSWAPYSYFRVTPEYGFAVQGDPDTLYLPGALIRAQVTNNQVGWLPRLTWRSGPGEIVAGGELRFHRSHHWGRLQYFESAAVNIPADYRYYDYKGSKDIASAYVHGLLSPSRDLRVMASVQYLYNAYRLYEEKFVGNDFTVPYHFVNPRLGVNYNVSPTWNAYLSAAYTSREPRLKNLYDAAEASTPASWGPVTPQFGVRDDGSYDFGSPTVTPEHLFNVELGTGYRSDAGSFTANVYWMEFADEIVRSGRVDRFGQPVTGNAGRTRHVGLELTGSVAAPAGFEVAANATVSSNRFVRHTDYSTGSAVSLDGNPIAGFPDVLANVRVTWRSGPAAVSLAGRYAGRLYTDNFQDNANTVDPYVVVNAWASYLIGGTQGVPSLTIRLQVNNLFDALYATYGEGAQFFVGAERNGFIDLTVGI
jgi:iron complex outermembrane receptor protein